MPATTPIRHKLAHGLVPGDVIIPRAAWASSPRRRVVAVRTTPRRVEVRLAPAAGYPTRLVYTPTTDVPVEAFAPTHQLAHPVTVWRDLTVHAGTPVRVVPGVGAYTETGVLLQPTDHPRLAPHAASLAAAVGPLEQWDRWSASVVAAGYLVTFEGAGDGAFIATLTSMHRHGEALNRWTPPLPSPPRSSSPPTSTAAPVARTGPGTTTTPAAPSPASPPSAAGA